MKLRALGLTIASVLAISLAGCGPFWVNPYITVKESHLNWVDIHYYNMNRKPYRRICVRVDGSGHVEVRKGTSNLVSDDFASKYKESTWGDVSTRRFDIPPERAQDIFQNLVNHGVLDREKTAKRSDKKEFKRFIAVKANISNNTYSEQVNIFEVDPDLAEQLLDVVYEMNNPTAR